MSVPTLRRMFLTAALVLSAKERIAENTSARTGTRMVYDESKRLTVMIGGIAANDTGTVLNTEPPAP